MGKMNGASISFLCFVQAACVSIVENTSVLQPGIQAAQEGILVCHPGVHAPLTSQKTNAMVTVYKRWSRAKLLLWSNPTAGPLAPWGCLGVQLPLPTWLTQLQDSHHGWLGVGTNNLKPRLPLP